MMTTSRWSTMVVKVLLVVAVVAVTTAVTVKCNQTLVLAATGGVTEGEDGVATKKTWTQVGNVVNDEWDAQHRVKDIGGYISRIAKKAKLKACQIAKGREKCHQFDEPTYRVANGATIREQAYEDVSNKASEDLHNAEKELHVLKSETQDEDEL